jgi:hypothetical protein
MARAHHLSLKIDKKLQMSEQNKQNLKHGLFESESQNHLKITKQLTNHDFCNIYDNQDPRTEDIEHLQI